MSLRLKFNLSLLLVMLTGLAVSGYLLNTILQKNALDEVRHEAGLLMETALAVRAYTITHVKPKLDGMLDTEFLPQTVPAFAATEAVNTLRKKYPEYAYKEATLNPTNPRDLADLFESKVVEGFRGNAALTETVGIRNTPKGQYYYIARPIQIKNPACLVCHSVPEAAPASMIRTYGAKNGFGWQLNEIVGTQMVSVPMEVPTERARRTLYAFLGAQVAVFVVMFIILNLLLARVVLRPIGQMSAAADAISAGKLDLAELDDSGKDEVAKLARSFNRMIISLKKALKMLRT